MYNFDEEYWNILGSGFSASGDAWRQREGNPHYVRPDSSIYTRGTDIIVFSQSIPPVSGSGATEDWIYGGILEIYNNTLRTDKPVAIAGATYSGCTIPTKDEWNAMTTEEQDNFKNTYFEPATPTSTTKIGVPIGDYYTVSAWVGVVVRGGDYPTDPNFPYYVIWGDLTTGNGAKSLNYNLETGESTHIDLNIILAENFKPEEEGVFRALIVQTQQQQSTQFWAGYSSSGMHYVQSTRGREPEPCNAISFNLRKFDWKMKADKNNGYPYKRDVEVFDFNLITPPTPNFYWTVSKTHNNGYASLGVGWQPVYIGAFTYASNVKNVSIPRSVNFIGEYAFRNTQIAEVTIDRACTRSDTSFPKDCDVNFYNN